MDLMEVAKSSLDSQVQNQIANALGTDSQTVARAIGGALPAIFGGMARQVSNPTGANTLSAALEKVDPAMLNNLSSMLSGSNLQSLIELGTKLLPAVFGPNYSSLFATLGKITGLGTGKIGPFLGILVPIVLSTLAKIKKSSGVDTAGLSRLVLDQTKGLSGLDSGLASQLGLGKVVGAGQQVAETTTQSIQKGVDMVRGTAVKGSRSISRVLIPLLALLALALALYIFNFNPDRGEVLTPKDSSMLKETKSSSAANEADELPASSPRAITGFLADATKAFAEIKDEAEAKSAAETLQGLAARVDSLKLNTLAGPAKAAAVTAVKKFLTEANSWAEKAYAVPGVKPILDPAVNAVVDKLKAFAK